MTETSEVTSKGAQIVSEVMTAQAAADYLRLNTDQIHRLITSGRIPATKQAGDYRIQKGELDSFLEANADDPILRAALFRRVLEVAEANPGVDSDEILEELEAYDEERKKAKHVNARDE
jgi:excisionase family DNA binding protein